MKADEKYDIRVKLCRTLKVLEDEIDKVSDIKNKYIQTNGSKKVTLSIYVDGETIQYELSETLANKCLENIKNSYIEQKHDVVQTLKQELM